MSEGRLPLLALRGLITRFHTMDGIVNAVDGMDFDL